MSRFRRMIYVPVALLALCAIASNTARAQIFDQFFDFGSVYTATNDTNGNEVQAYLRLPQGSLIAVGNTATGGTGLGGGLGNQGGMTLSENGRWLLVVNAGDNTVSVFLVGFLGELYLTDVEPSGGQTPVSVTIHNRSVYVLNGAGAGNIQGFELSLFGDLVPLADSSRPLSGAATTAPAQIQFSPSGDHLVVTEKATNVIDTYQIDGDGIAQGPLVQASNGVTPFGFDFNHNGTLVVSEAFGGAAGASAASSYSLQGNGALQTISASVPDFQSAACWIEITRNGRFAYTTNTASGNISGYFINPFSGALSLLGNGVSAETGAGSGPIDVDLTTRGRFLYVLNSGTQEIMGFSVNSLNGNLSHAATVSDVPAGANGLIAR